MQKKYLENERENVNVISKNKKFHRFSGRMRTFYRRNTDSHENKICSSFFSFKLETSPFRISKLLVFRHPLCQNNNFRG
jgi:hypothetical protein